jgi:hypothetical protein
VNKKTVRLIIALLTMACLMVIAINVVLRLSHDREFKVFATRYSRYRECGATAYMVATFHNQETRFPNSQSELKLFLDETVDNVEDYLPTGRLIVCGGKYCFAIIDCGKNQQHGVDLEQLKDLLEQADEAMPKIIPLFDGNPNQEPEAAELGESLFDPALELMLEIDDYLAVYYVYDERRGEMWHCNIAVYDAYVNLHK